MSKSILIEAERIVNGPRRDDYGHPADDYGRVARMWSALLGCRVEPHEAALCMIAVKLSRQVNRPKRDNLVDIAGYASVADMILERAAGQPEPGGIYYFAHPLSAISEGGARDYTAEAENFRLATQRTAELMQRGYNVFSPITHSWPVQECLGHEQDSQLPWYELDNEVIAATRWAGLIAAPGWEKSTGCKAEHALFLSMGLPVFEYADLMEEADHE